MNKIRIHSIQELVLPGHEKASCKSNRSGCELLRDRDRSSSVFISIRVERKLDSRFFLVSLFVPKGWSASFGSATSELKSSSCSVLEFYSSFDPASSMLIQIY